MNGAVGAFTFMNHSFRSPLRSGLSDKEIGNEWSRILSFSRGKQENPPFSIWAKETPVIPASLPPHRQADVLHEISDTAKAVLLYTFGRSLTCFQPGGWFR